MSKKPKIFFVKPQVEPPSSRYPSGRNADGAYILEGNVLTLVHPTEGYPVEDAQGKHYTYTLPDNFLPVDVTIHAERLTKEFRLVRLGKTPRDPGSGTRGFGRPLKYPKGGGF
jgi:hypothetical protein